MLILRFVVFVAVISIGLSLAIGLFTNNRRYLNLAWQLFKFFAVFALVVMALFVLERLIPVL